MPGDPFEGLLPALAQAIGDRRSTRQYSGDPIPAAARDELERFAGLLAAPFPHDARVSVHDAPPGTAIFYFKGPPALAAMSAPDTARGHATLGFVGELFLLRATALGVATCWIGHYKQRAAADALAQGGHGGERLACLTPLGPPPARLGLVDRMARRVFARRKPVEAHLPAGAGAPIPAHVRRALELACLAPSGMNNQCWLFDVDARGDGGCDVGIHKPAGYRHFKWPHVNVDVGCAASHFWVALRAGGVPVDVRLDDDGETAAWRFRVGPVTGLP